MEIPTLLFLGLSTCHNVWRVACLVFCNLDLAQRGCGKGKPKAWGSVACWRRQGGDGLRERWCHECLTCVPKNLMLFQRGLALFTVFQMQQRSIWQSNETVLAISKQSYFYAFNLTQKTYPEKYTFFLSTCDIRSISGISCIPNANTKRTSALVEKAGEAEENWESSYEGWESSMKLRIFTGITAQSLVPGKQGLPWEMGDPVHLFCSLPAARPSTCCNKQWQPGPSMAPGSTANLITSPPTVLGVGLIWANWS